jgi:16S rRNA processing protein RimM
VEPTARPSYIAIARIARPRGNRGEVLADLLTDFPARFENLGQVWLELEDGRRKMFVLEESWSHQGRLVLKFAGIDSIAAAQELAGAWVEVVSEDAVRLPEGTYFDHELIGCIVREVDGESLGEVTEVLRIEGNNQLVVNGPRGEFMIPAVEAICKKISITEKEILVDLPEGLIDLNR